MKRASFETVTEDARFLTVSLTDANKRCLEMRPSGSTLWRYRYRMIPKENTFAIGAYPTVGLKGACGSARKPLRSPLACV
ncbi:Arm DNA-binding domain-containing protein [Burkholderia cenocepacia]|uniref:Arm DNA-binding domain-containing protein n=1 Tax=Burkholderia cenocepacia TaxID=95486 RepID=UPI0039B88D51